ncbi:transcription elongation factor SPT6-like [Culicoides brevitarsis]|uniref:transcription elongation factor SPT6-like n=1 Tax=Culicoides brevitarsis TaxID=469753 RepID=UPI00307C824C
MDFLDSEAEESDQSEEEDLEPQERKKLKKMKQMVDSSEEEDEDDGEEVKDLIDDNPIEEEDSGEDSDEGPSKRKKSDDEDELDDRLEDEDYDLIEENLGVKVQRKRFKRLRKIQDEESDQEEADESLNREVIADQLFQGSDDEEERQSERSHRPVENLENLDDSGEEESDADDFIVDDDGVPLTEKKKKKKRPMFTDASLQEGQDIFGVDFDFEEFEKYDDEEEYEDESEPDEYEEDGEEREKRPKKAARKRINKKSIFDIYEPSELKRGHFTDLDNEIRKTDIPERMQLREVPITAVPEGSNELDEEADWIYKQAFCKPPISQQAEKRQQNNDSWDTNQQTKKPLSTIPKIKQALDFMRNQQLEVPFIAFYRKEYVQPELNITDLWKVYKWDARWCQLFTRKRRLVELFKKMQEYQTDKLMANPDAPIPDDVLVIKDDDIDNVYCAQTPEELKDIHNHFLLYHAHEIPNMREAWRRKEKERKKLEKIAARRKELENLEEGAEPPPPIQSDDEGIADTEDLDQLKIKMDSGPYSMCRKAGLASLAKKFGLRPEHYAENLRDSYQRHEVDQEQLDPTEVAKQYISPKFGTVEEVLDAAKFMVARQLSREPLLRKVLRETYFERAKLSVTPTKKGMKEIDENHNCYTMKYLLNKPVRELTGDQFLKLHIAENDKLLTMTIHERIDTSNSQSFLEEAKSLYSRDEFAKSVQDWNALRAECVELALTKMVLPDLRKELHAILLNEAKEFVLKACCKKLYNWIKIAPYSVNFQDEDEYDWDTSKGVRVMGVAYVPDYSQAAFCAISAPDGDITDYLRVPHILKRKNAHREDERELKQNDLDSLTDFIRSKKPHVIVVGGESREAIMIQQDLRECVKKLTEDEQFPEINVEIVDNELAKIYANSNKGTSDFREYPPLLRQAVSLARKLQDPLVEYSQLCTSDEEILCLRYHTLQEQLNKEELLENLYLEFINRTNEIGVDVNLAVQNPLTQNLVQFICGLGPRKGQALIKVLKQTNQRLENRTQLVTACHMGPKVFINCSGFIKIDTNSLGDSTEAYVEVLDGSRVHPETYEWARKMAVDALEYDDEDANPAGALEEILEAPERLKDLDLDAFAEELERQGFGNKSITLYDIRAELNSRYKDLRVPYQPLNSEEIFDVLTKETPETFYVGKLVLVTVCGISHKKPQADQFENVTPVRNEETGLWQCPFCLKNDFHELSEVWHHFDSGDCAGQATGVKVRLDNGLNGYIHIKNLSDSHVKNPEERVKMGQAIHVRIIKIDVERFSVDCTSKSSDLADRNNEWRPRKDQYYDQAAEDRDLKREEDSKKQKDRQMYVKRVIAHSAFMNKSYAEALKIMATKEQGEVIIRPSSKGSDHLTVTWKVADDVYQHIDVREEGKENAFSLGRSLWIGSEEFEDLDEIIARHINPMAGYARDLLSYKYYLDTQGGMKDKAEEALREEKRKNPNKIHYFISVSKNYPGKFLLSYLPRTRTRHEYITVTPDGFRYRQQIFDSINTLLKWFKEHYKDPLPAATPHTNTPRGGSTSLSLRSPYTVGNSSINNDAIRKVAQNMPSSMLHSLSQVTNTTPQNQYTPGTHGGQSSYTINTPYTPSGQTPYINMTPYATPHASQTPRYGQTTPSLGQKSPFLHPGLPLSAQRVGASPYQQSPSSHSRGYAQAAENSSWERASEAWGAGSRSQMGGQRSFGAPQKEYDGRGYNNAPRGGGMSRPGSGNRYDNRPTGYGAHAAAGGPKDRYDSGFRRNDRGGGGNRGGSRFDRNDRGNRPSRFSNNSRNDYNPPATSQQSNRDDDDNWDNEVPAPSRANSGSTPRNDYQSSSKSRNDADENWDDDLTPAKSPAVHSVSTPKTNTSPKSMTMSGDQTPLWDED